MLQQSEHRRKSDLMRTLTASSRDTSSSGKKRQTKEKMTVEEELEKCIQDFQKIKIPERFPERKYMWQADLLRKYRLWSRERRKRRKYEAKDQFTIFNS